MWKKEANNMHKKHLPNGRKCIFKSAMAPTVKVMFQNHIKKNIESSFLEHHIIQLVSSYLKITFLCIFGS